MVRFAIDMQKCEKISNIGNCYSCSFHKNLLEEKKTMLGEILNYNRIAWGEILYLKKKEVTFHYPERGSCSKSLEKGQISKVDLDA